MKKKIFSIVTTLFLSCCFAIIASIFVACNQHNDVDYVNQDVYGIWAATYNYPHTDVLDTLICHINEYNS